jgi:hypothetical protein
VAVSSASRTLTPALDLILQPLLVETLMAIGEGWALVDAMPVGTDLALLGSALDRLVRIGAVEAPCGGLLDRHTLTARGERLLGLLDELNTCMARAGQRHPV